MNLKEAVKVMSGTKTQSEVASLIETSQGALGTMLSRNNMQIKTLLKIANVLGYEIILRPTSGKDKAERTVILDDLGINKEE